MRNLPLILLTFPLFALAHSGPPHSHEHRKVHSVEQTLKAMDEAETRPAATEETSLWWYVGPALGGAALLGLVEVLRRRRRPNPCE